MRRLGKRTSDKSRPLKIELKHKHLKFDFLNVRKSINSSKEIQKHFSKKIFINTDSSFLMRKEEFRLRERLREMKRNDPNMSSYIRAGVLYQDDRKVDEVDVCSHLF